jgi:hypothetical protein
MDDPTFFINPLSLSQPKLRPKQNYRSVREAFFRSQTQLQLLRNFETVDL